MYKRPWAIMRAASVASPLPEGVTNHMSTLSPSPLHKLPRARSIAITAGLFAFALAGALFGAVAAPAHADDGPACKATSFKVAQVEKACKSGGQKAAKKLMAKVVKEQKAAGNKINCKSCHGDLKSFSLSANAVTDLKRYLGK